MTVKRSKFILLGNLDALTEEARKLDTILSYSKRLKTACKFKEEFRKIFEDHQIHKKDKMELLRWLKKDQSIDDNIM